MTKLAAPASRPRNWADLRLRVASALVLAPLALAAVWLGGLPWILLLAVGFAGLTIEWTQLCGTRLRGPGGALVVLAVLAGGGFSVAGRPGSGLAVLAVGTALVAIVAAGSRDKGGQDTGRQDTGRQDKGRRMLAFGVPYLGLAAVALPWLRDDDTSGRSNLIFVLLVVWGSDIGAYLVGRLIGGAKLAPRISPGKTWSGALGGLVAAAVLPVLVFWPAGQFQPVALPLAAALSVVAQAGDLLESGIKRYFGVKDSGWLIPGHGGLLDRLDALLAAAPLAALLAAGLGRGVLP